MIERTCWTCKHRLTKKYALPPIRCHYYEDVPLYIISGEAECKHFESKETNDDK